MPVKVMIVDDSAVVRQTLARLLESHTDIEIMDTAPDPIIAAEKLRKAVPDVIILDIEMPRMDGLTFLKTLMKQHPLPVIMCSSKVEEGSQNVFQALEYGAVDVILKPRIGTKQFLEESMIRIQDAVIGAHMTKVKKYKGLGPSTPKLTADSVLPRPRNYVSIETTEKIAVVGASTGGTEAIRVFLEALPVDAPGIVIVQHMPEKFTAAFASRLDVQCKVTVKEASDNDSVLRGTVLIAPGNKHALLKRSGSRYYVTVEDGPLVSRHRPSVDVLFRSAATFAGKNVVGVLMTGMGADGAAGMLEMKQAGSRTVCQDEKSCVVYGMPKEAVKLGAADVILPLSELASEVLNFSRG